MWCLICRWFHQLLEQPFRLWSNLTAGPRKISWATVQRTRSWQKLSGSKVLRMSKVKPLLRNIGFRGRSLPLRFAYFRHTCNTCVWVIRNIMRSCNMEIHDLF